MACKLSEYEGVPLAILDILPNPVLIKDKDTSYVWVNYAFETLFSVKRDEIRGKFDKQLFPDRQVSQCNGGDLRVLETGDVDEAYEEVFHQDGTPCETITRKSRLTLEDGTHLLVGVMHDVTEVVTANRELEQKSVLLRDLANTDSMTGCLNRRALFNSFDEKNLPNGGLLLLDIDHFKTVNDRFGHEMGDAALIHFANTVQGQIRDCDLLARLGGEEFVVYMPNADQKNYEIIAERIRKAVDANPLIHNGQEISMTVSIGGSITKRQKKTDLEALLQEADNLLYKAKQSGRNRYELAA